MKACVFPSDDKGCGNNRMRWPAEATRAEGVEVDFMGALPVWRAWKRGECSLMYGGTNPAGEHVVPDADVMVFQRVSNFEIVDLFKQIQAHGQAVVVDVDDDIAAVHPENQAHHRRVAAKLAEMGRDPTVGVENPEQVKRACELADLVTVTTPTLAKIYAPHGRVRVLPNCVPAAMVSMPRDSDGLTVGWAGWVGNHPHDLEVTSGGVAAAIHDVPGAHFLQIGPDEGVKKGLGLESLEATGGFPVQGYHLALGALDVGICPLEATRFNESKSWLKPLEMAARGVVPVMSCRPDYVRIHNEGVGLLAAGKRISWRKQVRDLLALVPRREEIAEAGYRFAESHTFEGNAWRWAEAWADAIAIRKGAKAA